MIGGLGLGTFSPVDMKERASSSSSFGPKSSAEDTSAPNSFSAAQNKSLAKSENKSEKKLEKNEQSQKTAKSDVSEKSSKSEKSENPNLPKLDKKQAKEGEENIQKAYSNATDIPQMQMLQGVQPAFVNQTAQTQQVSPIKNDSEVNLEVKVSVQTQPVLKFLKAMQENFGIQPQQVMKALSEMPQETLMKSPHQAMTPLFEKLGLQPKQFTKAQILYTEMLSELEKVEPEMFNGKTAAAMAAPAPLMQASQTQAAELPAPMLEKPMAAPKSTLDQLIEQKISRRALEPQNMRDAMPVKAQQPQVNMAQVFKMDNVTGANSMSPANDLVALDKLQQFDPLMRIEDIKINPNRVTEQFLSDAPVAAGLSGAAIAALSNKSEDKEMSEEEMKDQLAEQLAADLKMPGEKKLDGQFAVDKLVPASAATAGQAPGQLSNENIEKILSGSKSLIQKGGGEMKIQLSPEGLGKLHLNIKVQDGQVGVQMMTDTVEAKKLLENSMSDLKLTLAEHKLNLNHVKVDVSEQTSQNMNQHNHDFKREEARDFLGQFRQFNESMRQGAFDTSGLKAYRKTSQPTPDIQPIESKRAKSDNSSGLYLVA